MKILPVAVGILSLAAFPATAGDLTDHFRGLDGACWQSHYSDGGTDTRCFHVAAGGLLAINTHKKVQADGAVRQEGVTTSLLDKNSGVVEETYYNSLGFSETGTSRREGESIHFYSAGEDQSDATWILSSDHYVVSIEGKVAMTYVKVPDIKPPL